MNNCTITLESEVVIRVCEAVPAHVENNRQDLIEEHYKSVIGKLDWSTLIPSRVKTKQDAIRYMKKTGNYWFIFECGGSVLWRSKQILEALNKTKASTITLDIETVNWLFYYE